MFNNLFLATSTLAIPIVVVSAINCLLILVISTISLSIKTILPTPLLTKPSAT